MLHCPFNKTAFRPNQVSLPVFPLILTVGIAFRLWRRGPQRTPEQDEAEKHAPESTFWRRATRHHAALGDHESQPSNRLDDGIKNNPITHFKSPHEGNTASQFYKYISNTLSGNCPSIKLLQQQDPGEETEPPIILK